VSVSVKLIQFNVISLIDFKMKLFETTDMHRYCHGFAGNVWFGATPSVRIVRPSEKFSEYRAFS